MKHLALAIVFLAACKSSGKDEAKLEMSSNTPACKKAMSCCELHVAAERGKTTPEDINLMCSGVALATTDAACDEFRKGYAASFEEKSKPVPAECK